ncbi:C-X-C motif chemokine 10-like isoform X1 [Ranitomeya imitator]|uniref:C-X-C motif chemokine 10-like isoform X1 n=2 Tax=Ranitomeya imitator TaxID=111125 RepID=UPI0037E965E3
MYRPVIVLCMLFLLQPCVQGMSLLGKRRCLCMGNGADHVDLKQIKKFEFFPPSSKCEKMEVIAKFKHKKKGLCLNPHSELVKSVVALSKKKSSDEK